MPHVTALIQPCTCTAESSGYVEEYSYKDNTASVESIPQLVTVLARSKPRRARTLTASLVECPLHLWPSQRPVLDCNSCLQQLDSFNAATGRDNRKYKKSRQT